MRIILICGVPGSGKTWIAKQLQELEDCYYFPHDAYPVALYAKALYLAASSLDLGDVMIAEAPFRISVLEAELNAFNFDVDSYFIIETPEVVAARYKAREGKPIPSMHLKKLVHYLKSPRAWKATGTSAELLEIIKGDVTK